jgi:hypothetical protein
MNPILTRTLTDPTEDARAALSALAHVFAIAGLKAGVNDDTLFVDMSETSARDFGRAIALVRHLEALAPGGFVEHLRLVPDLEALVDEGLRRVLAEHGLSALEAAAAVEQARTGGRPH